MSRKKRKKKCKRVRWALLHAITIVLTKHEKEYLAELWFSPDV